MTRRTRRRRRFPGPVVALLACALTVTAQSARGAVLTVDVNGGGQFTAILPAIANAADGDTVLVAPGTYTGLGNYALDFEGKNITLTSSHGAEQTIIDLDGEGGIILENGESLATVIAGFTFTNSGTGAYQGAIYASYSAATVRDCIFTGNRRSVYFHAGGPILIEDCEFSDNGGPALNVSTSSVPGVLIRSCVFRANCQDSAYTADGGALRLLSGTPGGITVVDCEFIDNWARRDGGAIDTYGEGISIQNSTFTGNSAGRNGGAFRSYDPLPPAHSGQVITGCTFSGNRSGQCGGAIHRRYCPLVVTECVFEGNTAVRGGAVYCCDDASDPVDEARLSISTFVGNRAEMGAGIMCAESAPQLDACLFDSNRATLWGGGICADGAYEHRPSVRHCTFTRNSAHRGGALLANDEVRPIVEHCTFYGCGADDGMIAVLSDASLRVANSIVSFAPRSEPFHLQFGTATIEHCVIFGSAAGDSLPPGNPDNIFIDPLFCDVYHDDFTLCENSPCLAANNAWGEPVGAHAVGCAECTTKVQAATWGRIKAMYR